MVALWEEGARLQLEGNRGERPWRGRAREEGGLRVGEWRGGEGRGRWAAIYRGEAPEHGCHVFSIAAIHRTRGECYSSDIGRPFLAFSAWIRTWVTVAKIFPMQYSTSLIKGSQPFAN
jgi:hypothetical protein